MIMRLVIVPPGGGEADYSLEFDLPSIPRAGDCITIRRGAATHTEDFIVRRSMWQLTYPDTGSHTAKPGERGDFAAVVVECEFAIGPFSSASHKRTCEALQSRTGKLHRFDDTAY